MTIIFAIAECKNVKSSTLVALRAQRTYLRARWRHRKRLLRLRHRNHVGLDTVTNAATSRTLGGMDIASLIHSGTINALKVGCYYVTLLLHLSHVTHARRDYVYVTLRTLGGMDIASLIHSETINALKVGEK